MDSNDVLSLICLLVDWLQRTWYINLFHNHSSMKVIDSKKAKKLLRAQSVQCKRRFVLAKFVYCSLDNVCIFIEWVQLTSYSTSRGSYNKKVLLLIELNCVLKEMEHEKWFVTVLVIYFFFILKAARLPLFEYLSEKLCGCCYERAWFAKNGG